MATIKLASNLATDKDGYAHGALSVIETVKTANGDKRSLMIDTHDVECFELIFECANTRNELMTIKTAIFGMTINPEPIEEKRIGKKMVKIYNKFTTVLMKLKIITNEEIEKARKDTSILDIDTITSEFLAIKELPVMFKPQKNAKGFIEPNLLTLEVTGDMPSSDATIEENNQ